MINLDNRKQRISILFIDNFMLQPGLIIRKRARYYIYKAIALKSENFSIKDVYENLERSV